MRRTHGWSRANSTFRSTCNFKKDFGRIIEYFVDEYANGRTPNPCALQRLPGSASCNEYATQLGRFVVGALCTHDDGARRTSARGAASTIQRSVVRPVCRHKGSQMLFPIGEMVRQCGSWRKSLTCRYLTSLIRRRSVWYPTTTMRHWLNVASRWRDRAISPDDTGRVVGTHKGSNQFTTIGQRRAVVVAWPS